MAASSARRATATLFLAFLLSCDAVSLNLRSKPEGRPGQPIEAPVVHTVLAKSKAETSTNLSTEVNATAESNSSIFRLTAYGPAIGKVFALYYSTMSGEKVTQIEARNYKALDAVPSDSVVFDPVTSITLKRGDCKLRLKSHTTVMSDMRKYNLRMAEVAVCEQFFGNPCGPGAKACEIEMFAPLPYDGDQERYIGAGMALTAHSMLCAQRTEAWKRDSCALVRNKAAIAAGLQQSASGIKLRPIPGALTDLKMDATYELGFQEAVFATANKPDYHNSEHYENQHDVLHYSRTPPKAAFCEDLSCLIAKFQQR